VRYYYFLQGGNNEKGMSKGQGNLTTSFKPGFAVLFLLQFSCFSSCEIFLFLQKGNNEKGMRGHQYCQCLGY